MSSNDETSSLLNDLFRTSDPIPCILDNLLSPPENIDGLAELAPWSHQVKPELVWCLKKGSRRGHQFWVYCEKSQSNYAKVTIKAEGITLTATSEIMMDALGHPHLVEDASLTNVKAISLFTSHPTVKCYPSSCFRPTDVSKFHITLALVPDEEEPRIFKQGNAQTVQFSAQQIKCKHGWGAPPLSYFFEIHFQMRTEGWFRLQSTIMYEDMIIAQGLSSTFMFNNPRMRKLHEHKLYTPKELKFMHTFSHCSDKNAFMLQYRYLLSNSSTLFQVAENLFPKSQRLIKSAGCIPGCNELKLRT